VTAALHAVAALGVLDVVCPTCKVPPKRYCVRPSGHATFGKKPHASRYKAAGLEVPKESGSDRGGSIPTNVLCFPDEELALERAQRLEELLALPPEPYKAPELAVPNDPPGLAVGTSLDAYSGLLAPLYETTLGKLYQGDSQALMGHMEPNSVDLIFSSPPYALQRKKEYGNESQAKFVEWFMPFVHRMRRLLKPSGFLVLNFGPAWNKGSPTVSTYDIETLLMTAQRLHVQLDMVWQKPGTMPGPAQWVTVEKIRVTQATERIWIFSKDPRALEKLPEDVQFSQLLSMSNKASNSEYDRRCRANGLKQHPARFPPGLPRYFIERLTKPGDLVLDPFAGSNTTGQVAEEMGRRWLGIELDAAYARNSYLRFSPAPLGAQAPPSAVPRPGGRGRAPL
jgi:site-specific DNA-methyltransferase (cytosine-N4-specific)